MYNKYLFKNYTQGGILTLPKESNICFFLYIFKASFVLQNIRAILVMKLKKKHLYFIYYTYLGSFNFFKFSSGIYLKMFILISKIICYYILHGIFGKSIEKNTAFYVFRKL